MGMKFSVVGFVESFRGSDLTKDGLVQHVIKASGRREAMQKFCRAHPNAKHIRIRGVDPLNTGRVVRCKA